MSGIATAVGAGAVGNLLASNSAAHSETDAANNANALDASEFATEQANEAPYLAAGKSALGTLQADMPSFNQPFTMSQFQQDPGYQFDLQQGEQAVQNSSAASGHLISSQEEGNASNYADSMASNEYGNAFNRYQTQIQGNYNRLAGLAGIGQTATAGVNQAGQTATTNMSANTIGAGNAQAAGTVGAANAISGGIGGAMNGYMNYNTMNSLMGNGQNSNGISSAFSSPNAPGFSMPSMGAQEGYGGGTMSSLLTGG